VGIVRVSSCVAAGLAALALAAPAAAETGAPVSAPLHRSGPWMVDDQGRVVIAHGVDVVRKNPPFVRSEFTDADARLLADEGFTLARIGFIWEGVEPKPGVYDDAYIQRVLDLDSLLGRYGIRTLVDFHQDAWSRSTGGDGAPAWATLGRSADDSFAAFWRDDKGPGGVGIQTRFVDAWEHVARALAGHANILGLDPFNEPYPGSDFPPPCSDFSPCPSFESGPLAAFYRRVIGAIRSGGAQQTILPEGIADSGVAAPALPGFADPQMAFTWHFYCNVTQLDPREVDVGTPAPEATACQPIEQRDIPNFLDYAKGLGVPSVLGEFSCNDVNPDNAQIVDQVDSAFTSWTIWAYYTAADDPADCPAQSLLVDDKQPGSEANAKQPKLDALVVPYAQAIAGTPQVTGFDRSTRTFTLSYDARPGTTQVFVPARVYPKGYATAVTGATVVSDPGAPWLLLRSAGGSVSVKVAPRTDSIIRRPLETGALPLQAGGSSSSPAACASRRTVRFHLPRRARLASITVGGRRARSLVVSLRGRGAGAVRVRIVARTRGGRRWVRTSVLHPCTR